MLDMRDGLEGSSARGEYIASSSRRVRIGGVHENMGQKNMCKTYPLPALTTRENLPSSMQERGKEGTSTYIFGWKDPFETDTRLTKYMMSRCIKPCPILHTSLTDLSGVIICVDF